MTDINIFLRALEKVYKDRNIILVSKWVTTRDRKFPAYTEYVLEVVEIYKGTPNHRFVVQQTENMSQLHDITYAEEAIKKDIIEKMTSNILKYYMYGETV